MTPPTSTTKKTARKGAKRSKAEAAARDVSVVNGEVLANAGIKTKANRTKPKAKAKKKGKGKGKKPVYSAKTADIHELYQLAVQSPEVDADFLARLYKRLRKKPARHLREDFCGTGYLASAWLRRNKDNTAEGFDIDEPTVAWGLERNFAGIEQLDERVDLQIADVREPSRQTPDIRCAPNFTERADLKEYFEACRKDLPDDGLYVIDIYGGPEAFEEMEEERKIGAGFTYVWEQVHYHPATGGYRCKIHFRFKDGTQVKSAYDYTWRLWNLPEVMDLLKEAGFGQVDSYWEGTDEDGESGNGIYRKSKLGENCPAWVTYIVAQP
jgi:hypothetical protein